MLFQLVPCTKYFQYIGRPESRAFKFQGCTRVSTTLEMMHRPWVIVFCGNTGKTLPTKVCSGIGKGLSENLCLSASCEFNHQASFSNTWMTSVQKDWRLPILHIKHVPYHFFCSALLYVYIERHILSQMYGMFTFTHASWCSAALELTVSTLTQQRSMCCHWQRKPLRNFKGYRDVTDEQPNLRVTIAHFWNIVHGSFFNLRYKRKISHCLSNVGKLVKIIQITSLLSMFIFQCMTIATTECALNINLKLKTSMEKRYLLISDWNKV